VAPGVSVGRGSDGSVTMGEVPYHGAVPIMA
jgi:hypothetical protein